MQETSVEVSDDGKTFTKVASEEYPAMKETDKNGVYDHQLTFTPVTTQYVKVIAWHRRQLFRNGMVVRVIQAFLFVDEITIN